MQGSNLSDYMHATVQDPKTMLDRFEQIDIKMKVAWLSNNNGKLTEEAFLKCMEGLVKKVRELELGPDFPGTRLMELGLAQMRQGAPSFILLESGWAITHNELLHKIYSELPDRLQHRRELEHVTELASANWEELLEPLLRI